MKEMQPVGHTQGELTRIPTPSTLRRGSIFMADGVGRQEVAVPARPDSGQKAQLSQESPRTNPFFIKGAPEKLARKYWESEIERKIAAGEELTAEDRSTYGLYIKEGILPGLAGDSPDAPVATAVIPTEAGPEDPAASILRRIDPDDYSDPSLKRVAEMAQEFVENNQVYSSRVNKLIESAENMRLSGADKTEYEKLSNSLREAIKVTRRTDRFVDPQDIGIVAEHPLLKKHLEKVTQLVSKLNAGEFNEDEYSELVSAIRTTELPEKPLTEESFDAETAMTEAEAKERESFEMARAVLLGSLTDAVSGKLMKEGKRPDLEKAEKATEELTNAMLSGDWAAIERVIEARDIEDRMDYAQVIESAIRTIEQSGYKIDGKVKEYQGQLDHVIEFVLEYGMERILSQADKAPFEDFPQFSLYVTDNLDRIAHMARIYDETRARNYEKWGIINKEKPLENKRELPDMFGYLVNLRNKRRIMHELFRGMKDPNTYLQYVTQLLRKTGFKFVEKDVVGVADVQIFYEQALGSALALKSFEKSIHRGWLTDQDFEKADAQVKELLTIAARVSHEEFGKKLTKVDGSSEKRELRGWEIGRAAMMGRSLNAASQRRVVYAILGDLPDNPDLLYKSVEIEYIARRLAPLKMFADRFFGQEEAKEIIKLLREELRRDIDTGKFRDDIYGYVRNGKALGLYGHSQNALDILDLLIVDPKSNSWRGRLMFLKQPDFRTERYRDDSGREYKLSIGEYLQLVEDELFTKKDKHGEKHVDKKGFNNHIREVIKDQRLFLGILLRYDLDEANKEAIWKNVAELIPSRIAAFFPKETFDKIGEVRKMSDEEKMQLWIGISEGPDKRIGLRDKLWHAERLRVKHDAEVLHRRSEAKTPDEYAAAGKPLNLRHFIDLLDGDMKMTSDEIKIVEKIQQLGKEMAPALVKIKQPFTAFLDDVPKTDWEMTSDEDFNRILVSDQNDFSEGWGHIVHLTAEPVVPMEALIKGLTDGFKKVSGPPGIEATQKKFEPVVNAFMRSRMSFEVSKWIGFAQKMFRQPRSRLEKFNLQANLADDEEAVKNALTALAQASVIADNPSGEKDKKGRTQLVRMLHVDKANRKRQAYRFIRIIMLLLGPEFAKAFLGNAVNTKELGLA